MRRSCLLIHKLVLAVSVIAFFGTTQKVDAEAIYPVFTEIVSSGELVFGGIDIFDDTVQMDWEENVTFEGNQVLRATLVGGGDWAGIGFAVPVSNGENGIDETACVGPGGTCDGNGNIDIPNTEPVNPAIAAVNANGIIPGRLNNGNVLRGSVWMRSDPNNPAIGVGEPGPASMPQVEGIFKWEVWKEALSGFADFDGPGDSNYGDRIWDQDQQGAQGSFADINGDGFSGGFGASANITLSTTEWTQLVVEYVVDDNPADPGNTFFPWEIGLDPFTVADVEDVRLVFYTGDFTGTTNFAGGGSWLMDNLLLEIFVDQAAADAVDPAVVNPAPTAGLSADFDGDGIVDGHDFLHWQRNPGSDDLSLWEAQFGTTPLVNAVAAVPEPGSLALVLCGVLMLAGARRQ